MMKMRDVVAGLLGAVATSGCGGGGGAPAASSTVAADPSRGTFTLQGAGYENVTHSFTNAGGNHVFCRREAPLPNTIWVRLAQSRTQDGEASPHVDIDLCNFAGSAVYQNVHDVDAPRTCSQGQSFAVWWHDGARTYVSREDSSPCTVSVTRGEGTIEGSFECRGLTPFSGTGAPLDIPAGSFRCTF